VKVHIGPWNDKGFRSGPSVPIDLQPGQRLELDLGNGGAIVTGKAKLAGKVPAGLDCSYSLNYLVRREAGIAPRPQSPVWVLISLPAGMTGGENPGKGKRI
jgi:hypothetical protein